MGRSVYAAVPTAGRIRPFTAIACALAPHRPESAPIDPPRISPPRLHVHGSHSLTATTQELLRVCCTHTRIMLPELVTLSVAATTSQRPPPQRSYTVSTTSGPLNDPAPLTLTYLSGPKGHPLESAPQRSPSLGRADKHSWPSGASPCNNQPHLLDGIAATTSHGPPPHR